MEEPQWQQKRYTAPCSVVDRLHTRNIVRQKHATGHARTHPRGKRNFRVSCVLEWAPTAVAWTRERRNK